MKLFLCLFLLSVAHLIFGQSSLKSLESDPTKAMKSSFANGRDEGAVDLDFEASLSLPFFDDFTSVGPSIADISTTEGIPVVITTFQPHGFTSPTNILITEMKGQGIADYLDGTLKGSIIINLIYIGMKLLQMH